TWTEPGMSRDSRGRFMRSAWWQSPTQAGTITPRTRIALLCERAGASTTGGWSMKTPRFAMLAVLFVGCIRALRVPADKPADKPAPLRKAFIDGSGPDWKQLGPDDFVNVNCDQDTWTFNKDGSIRCTGQPLGVCRTKKQYTNFELVAEWKHEKRS